MNLVEIQDKARKVNVSVKPGRPVDIKITGNRDPRGTDNNVLVWLDENDNLHISIFKAERCYKFTRVIDHYGAIEVVQE